MGRRRGLRDSTCFPQAVSVLLPLILGLCSHTAWSLSTPLGLAPISYSLCTETYSSGQVGSPPFDVILGSDIMQVCVCVCVCVCVLRTSSSLSHVLIQNRHVLVEQEGGDIVGDYKTLADTVGALSGPTSE